MLSNAASQHIRPPIHPITDNVQTKHGVVIVVTVSDGLSKPYIDNHGRIWVKNGSDKRHVTAREEIQRLFQRAGLVYADIIPVTGTSTDDIDEKAFAEYFTRRYGQSPEVAVQPLSQLLQNLGLGDGQELNLAGLMLFGKRPQRYRPAFEVKAVAFPGLVLHDTRYLDSEDIGGTLLEQYQRSFAFIKRNLRHIQADRGLGTGIPCALHDWPNTELLNEIANNQFKVVILRPELQSQAPATGLKQSTDKPPKSPPKSGVYWP